VAKADQSLFVGSQRYNIFCEKIIGLTNVRYWSQDGVRGVDWSTETKVQSGAWSIFVMVQIPFNWTCQHWYFLRLKYLSNHPIKYSSICYKMGLVPYWKEWKMV